MVKAMDFESEGDCVHVRFPAQAIFKKKKKFYDDGGGALQASAKRERRRAGMSAANVGPSNE